MTQPQAAFFECDAAACGLVIANKQFTQQYSHVYFCRLQRLRPAVLQTATGRWKSRGPHCRRTLDTIVGQRCFLVGTVCIESARKPNILDEVSREYHLRNVSIAANDAACALGMFFDLQKNVFFLEDEFGRVTLRFSDAVRSSGLLDALISGCVLGVLGCESDDGFFDVEDVCFAGLPKQPPAVRNGDAQIVAVVSDVRFNIAADDRNVAVQADLLRSLVCGDLDALLPVAPISALVFCGNSLEEPQKIVDDAKKMKFGAANYKLDVDHFRIFDALVADIVASHRHVVLVPGPCDPANVTLPQQPILRGIFERSCSSPLHSDFLHLVTNPAIFRLGSLLVYAFSGQNVADASKYLNPHTEKPVLTIVKAFLCARHLAPTAPDTLNCYPFFEDDPFVIDEGRCPHVVLVGNQPSFSSDVIHGEDGQRILVVSVPSFKATNEVLLLNICDFSCSLVNLAPSLLNE